ncbi:MAG: FAD:protein FMN transferase [Verrucomicrobiota bacterium]
MAGIGSSPRVRLPEAPLREVASGFYSVRFYALGSVCQLFFGASSLESASRFRGLAASWLEQFEARYSRFLPQSEVSLINSKAGVEWVDVHPMTDVLLDLCAHSHFSTEGAFDATSLPLSHLWDLRNRRTVLPDQREVEAALALVGWGRVQRKKGQVYLPVKGMMLDFGGVGKEFAVDALCQLAIQSGVRQVMVDLGGDVGVFGDSPEGGGWYVGLEDPANHGCVFAGVRLQSGNAIATSGDYLRCVEVEGTVYGHILDCRKGWPVSNGTRSVTVITKRCVMAGLLSTAAMIQGGVRAIEMLERSVDVEGCVWSAGRLLETKNFRRALAVPREVANG